MTRVDEILEFWFGLDCGGNVAQRNRTWFTPDQNFDAACRAGFLADYEKAAAGELDAWKENARSCLALILLLDQFPRNVFRGSARAFATDARALATAREALARSFDQKLPPSQRLFVYMPFEHSENLDDQRESVRLISALEAEPGMAGNAKYALEHFKTVERFGRFPTRNGALGRPSTAEEIEFLSRLSGGG